MIHEAFYIALGGTCMIVAILLMACQLYDLHLMRLEARTLETWDRTRVRFLTHQSYLHPEERARFFEALDEFMAGRS